MTSLLTPAIRTEFDQLATLQLGKTTNQPTLYHSGSIKQDSDFKPGEGVWMTKGRTNGATYAGQALNDFLKIGASTLTSMANYPNPTPYYTEMKLKQSGLNAVSFQGKSFAAIATTHFGGSHDLTKKALVEWAMDKGYDLVFDTNGGKNEVVVINPIKHLTITYCRDLVTGLPFTPTLPAIQPAPANQGSPAPNLVAAAIKMSGHPANAAPSQVARDTFSSRLKAAIKKIPWPGKGSRNAENDEPSP